MTQRWIDLWVLLGLALLLGVFLFLIAEVLLPVFLSVVIAYVLLPVVERLERRGWSRLKAVSGLFAAGVLFVVGLGFMLVPIVEGELKDLRAKLPVYAERAKGVVGAMQTDLEARMPELSHINLAETVALHMSGYVEGLLKQLPEFLFSAFTLLSLFVLIPFITWYLMMESRQIKKACVDFVPNRYFEASLHVLHGIDQHLTKYLAGLWLESSLVGVMCAVGFSAIGVPFGAVIGMLTGLANMVPYVGFWGGTAVAALVTVLELGWTAKVLTILIVATAIHLVDAFAIQPAVLARVSNLHPLTVLLALLAGGDLFGLWGLFLAVPFVGAAKIVIRSMDAVLRRREPQPV